MGSPEEVLGVDADAGERAIQEAYRERVKEAHPDHGGSLVEFRTVRAAYEELRTRAEGGEPDGPAAIDEHDGGPDRQTEFRVEYLDYELLDDRGWSLEDDALFERAGAADLAPGDHGEFLVRPDETVLEAAERCGFEWPYACRGGACANCAVAVTDGEMAMPSDHVLTDEMVDRGIGLSCIGRPAGGDLRLVFNVKHLPDIEELLLPPAPFNEAYRPND